MFLQANHCVQTRPSSGRVCRHSSQSGTKSKYYQYHQSRNRFTLYGLQKLMNPRGYDRCIQMVDARPTRTSSFLVAASDLLSFLALRLKSGGRGRGGVASHSSLATRTYFKTGYKGLNQ